MTQLQSLTCLKEDWIEQPIVCKRPNLKPGYVDRHHLGETTRATALDLRSEDYEYKTYKTVGTKSLLLSEPAMFHRYFII